MPDTVDPNSVAYYLRDDTPEDKAARKQRDDQYLALYDQPFEPRGYEGMKAYLASKIPVDADREKTTEFVTRTREDLASNHIPRPVKEYIFFQAEPEHVAGMNHALNDFGSFQVERRRQQQEQQEGPSVAHRLSPDMVQLTAGVSTEQLLKYVEQVKEDGAIFLSTIDGRLIDVKRFSEARANTLSEVRSLDEHGIPPLRAAIDAGRAAGGMVAAGGFHQDIVAAIPVSERIRADESLQLFYSIGVAQAFQKFGDDIGVEKVKQLKDEIASHVSGPQTDLSVARQSESQEIEKKPDSFAETLAGSLTDRATTIKREWEQQLNELSVPWGTVDTYYSAQARLLNEISGELKNAHPELSRFLPEPIAIEQTMVDLHTRVAAREMDISKDQSQTLSRGIDL